ncbi:unnamed protein product, partial [Caretta caretta]
WRRRQGTLGAVTSLYQASGHVITLYGDLEPGIVQPSLLLSAPLTVLLETRPPAAVA